MPSPLRWPSRSVRVPGRVSRSARLGHQSTGRLLVPALGRPHTDDDTPQGPDESAVPPRKPEDADAAEPGRDDAAEAEAGPAEASTADPSPAETKPADVAPARSADTGPDDPGPADS